MILSKDLERFFGKCGIRHVMILIVNMIGLYSERRLLLSGYFK